jgi:hypothetical protein
MDSNILCNDMFYSRCYEYDRIIITRDAGGKIQKLWYGVIKTAKAVSVFFIKKFMFL